MIRHERFQMMVVWPRELSPRERVQLDRHLQSCPDCRETELMVAENRDQLRTLARLRPPQDIRGALLEAADASHDAASLYGPVILAFLILPMTWLALGLILIYGWIAVVGVIALLLAFGCATAIHGERVGGGDGMSIMSEDAIPWRELGRSIALDAAGVIAGGMVVGVLLLVLAALSGSLH
jgi:predicted anti-sigma-YlaC factor YlaD